MRGDTVTVFGSTGTGKTKLSVELAQAISTTGFTPYKSAEVISCDSMQIYRGLDIITNKATEEEMAGVKHHLLGFLEPGQEYDVTQFIADVKKLHVRLSSENQCTIIAGGTTYYLQHLLFPGRLVTSEEKAPKEVERDPVLDQLIASLPAQDREILHLVSYKAASKQLFTMQTDDPLRMWTLLQKLDPEMASRWHWKDGRKVSNSLRIIAETGRRPSQWIKEQDAQRAEQEETAETPVDSLRRLLIWVWCEPEILKKRLDDRVDEMVERGLLDEVREMRRLSAAIFEASTEGQTYQTGIFQTIGYKQFDEYLTRMDKLSTQLEQNIESQLFKEAVTKTQQATRRYAKDQIKWVRNKLVPEIRLAQQQIRRAMNDLTGDDDVQLYLLNATDKTQWDVMVRDPAIDIVKRFLNRQPLPDPTTLGDAAATHLFAGRTPTSALNLHGSTGETNEGTRTILANAMYECPECSAASTEGPFFVRIVDRQKHTKGKFHRANARPKLSEQEQAEEIERKKRLGEEKRRQREELKSLTPQFEQ